MTQPPTQLIPPATDPTPIVDAYRGNYATEILAAAVSQFDVFNQLAAGPLDFETLRGRLSLAPRPAIVLLTALCAMGFLERRPHDSDKAATYRLTPIAAEHLVAGGPLYVGDYVAPAASNPGTLELIERLRTNRPAGADAADASATEAPSGAGTAFIFRPGTKSAMDAADSARKFTLALAGRAKNVAPVLAARAPLANARVLLDVGGGTGIYAFAYLQKYPQLRAVLWDRAEVLKVAREFAQEYGVAGRVEFVAGDMFHDPVPEGCDAALLSNVLHDWDMPECAALVERCSAALPASGRVLVHDVFLNDALDGPLPIALYSAALFVQTEGRAYSAAEYRRWLSAAGLTCGEVMPTLMNCGVLVGTK